MRTRWGLPRARDHVVLWLVLLAVSNSPAANGQTTRRVFTVPDDIGLTYFGDTVKFSPDDQLFLVESNRGRIDLNRPESSLRIYRVSDVEDYLARPDEARGLAPMWTVTKSTYKYGPIINNVRWLRNSRGIAFLAKSGSGSDRLFLADIRSRKVVPLTSESEHVTAFDVRSEKNFVYTILSSKIGEKADQDRRAPFISGTGRSLDALLFPEDALRPNVFFHDLSDLWAVVAGRRFRVMDPATHQPVPLHFPGQMALALNPNGHSVLTALTVEEVPPRWEQLYPPESPASKYRIRAGRQDPYAFSGQYTISQYVVLDLQTGTAKTVTHAPLSFATGWYGSPYADWSPDGKTVVLSSTFLPPKDSGIGQPRKPCVAVGDPSTAAFTCIEGPESTEGTTASGREQFVGHAYFAKGNKDVVVVPYWDESVSDWPIPITYARQADGSWKNEGRGSEPSDADHRIAVTVKEGMNDPPILLATDKKTQVARTLWNPNPQLHGIKLGEVSVLEWKDKAGRQWRGGLYKPPDYSPGKRYPLVIQTHGFNEHSFHADGIYPTVFAAQELAGVGFLVLQVVHDCPVLNDREGACQAEGYEAGVQKLTSDGVVDPHQVGLIGFSRSCFHVLAALTSSTLRFRAALIADGVKFSYLDYLTVLDFNTSNTYAAEVNANIGSSPFSDGLNLWLRRAPGFNMDKVTAPLQVVATSGVSLLLMWEPYAALRYLHKPVDLLVLNSEEHVFTNPKQRLISQSNTIDWFRFWLQGYEDPAPEKSEQYRRWEDLCDMQVEQALDRPVLCVRSKPH